MRISIVNPTEDTFGFRAVDVGSFQELGELATQYNISTGIFKGGHRKRENFEVAYCIGLDFDNDPNELTCPPMTLEEAKVAFAKYRHIILTSRSHGIDKNGHVADRFRVILILERPITDQDEFYSTWHWCKTQWPAIDDKCKDPSRLWYKHSGVAHIQRAGLKVTPIAAPPKEPTKGNVDVSALPPGSRGELSKDTFKLLASGVSRGGRSNAVYKASKDFQQNLYTIEEAEACLLEALNRTETIARDFTEDEARTTIRSAFNSEAKHDPRITPPVFQLKRIGELYNETHGAEIEWLVDGLLQVAGVSLLAADPKAGKSVIARQLCASILTGEPFFSRTVRKGTCHYYGLEEHPTIVARSFSTLGVAADAQLFVHCGDPLVDENVFAEFSKLIMETKPALAIIDTAFDLIEVESENNYRDVKRALKAVRTVARNSGTHIVLIHHAGKPQQDNRRRGNHAVLGSTAIVGGVDAIMVIQIFGSTRVIYTSGREVEPWNGRILEWNGKTKTYSLGRAYDEF